LTGAGHPLPVERATAVFSAIENLGKD
jgi:hypothetical protein